MTNFAATALKLSAKMVAKHQLPFVPAVEAKPLPVGIEPYDVLVWIPQDEVWAPMPLPSVSSLKMPVLPPPMPFYKSAAGTYPMEGDVLVYKYGHWCATPMKEFMQGLVNKL